MPTAGSPASARPSSARSTSRSSRPGASAAPTPSTTAAVSDHTMTGRRPHRSDSAPAGMTPSASAAVVTETDSDAVPGVVP
jgi:hypothetical protein